MTHVNPLLVRSIEDWKKIFAGLPSPEGISPERVIANRILGDLFGYRSKSKDRDLDARQLANALEAYMALCAQYGVQVAGLK